MLRAFIAANTEEILARARVRVSSRSAPAATEMELSQGLPLFLEQLREALRKANSREPLDHAAIHQSALDHGGDLYLRGLTVAQVVHDYGDLCQVLTELAVEKQAPIPASDFQTLNLCLDDAIAGAVTSFGRLRERAIANEGTERLGILAHEMRNVLNAAMMSFASLKRGDVGPGGSTSAIHYRSLLRLNVLIDRSLADVRLDAGIQTLESVAVRDIVEEAEIAASLVAQTRGLKLAVTSVDPSVVVRADRQSLVAAVANLLQNALKFTRPGTRVWLDASATDARVLLAVEDECGGLPPGGAESLLRPFAQAGSDRSGLGLGLSVCRKAAQAVGGELRIRDLPGRGCVFALDLPRQIRDTPSPRMGRGSV